ncbi:acyl carrier protein [Nocardioides solisilvae]|uniref:acyl carrier protein n=1 Tax=Nocardioides solisilvae TaxID=1542435 RepID=UPI000D74CB5C|nr:acyl carrier protein [Nocardioides solisilvae]
MAEAPTATATGAAAPSRDDVRAELERILTDVVGDDLLLDGPLTDETSFDADLQLESIEFVALADQLLATYGEQVDFVGWMAGMQLDEIIGLTVGQVVDFVVSAVEG